MSNTCIIVQNCLNMVGSWQPKDSGKALEMNPQALRPEAQIQWFKSKTQVHIVNTSPRNF